MLNAWEANFKAPSWSDEENETLRRLWADGLSGSQIGALINRSRSAVLGQRRRLGLPGRAQERAGLHAHIRKPNPARDRRKENEAKKAKRAAARALKEDRAVARKMMLRRPAQIICEPVGLMDARTWHCRYHIGGGADGLAIFCGAFVVPGTSWCAGHSSVVYDVRDK